MSRLSLLVFALLAASCAHPSRSLLPLYDELGESLHVELLGVDPDALWARAKEVVESRGLGVRQESRSEGEGVLELSPFDIELPGRLSSRYTPARIVASEESESVTLHHALTLHLEAHEGGLARLWWEGEVSVNGYEASRAKAPRVVAHRLLRLIVEPFAVVKTWRLEER